MMMSFALSSHLTKAPLLPFHHHQSRNNTSIFCGVSRPTTSHLSKLKAQDDNVISEPSKKSGTTISNLAILGSTLLVTVSEPASAVTGVNYFDDGLIWTLAQLAISAFVYFLVVPPIVLNWLRVRWYRRGFVEMYLQFMFVFMFFPGLLLWAPFLNFRKFPRDPSMKYPWSRPENPALIKSEYRKYPWATPEDYD